MKLNVERKQPHSKRTAREIVFSESMQILERAKSRHIQRTV